MKFISYLEVKPRARPVVSLQIPQGKEHGLVGVDLIDSHCVTRGCLCQMVTLGICSLLLTPHPPQWTEESVRCDILLDYCTREIRVEPAGHRLGNWAAEALREAFDAKLAAKLARRAHEVRAWSQAPWEYRDWSDFEPGDLVPYTSVAPLEDPPQLDVGGATYVCLDQYCCTVGCTCTEMAVSFASVRTKREVGGVWYDFERGEVGKVRGADSGLVHQLMTTLLTHDPGIKERWRRRAAFMGSTIANYLHEKLRYPIPATAPPAPVVAPRAAAPAIVVVPRAATPALILAPRPAESGALPRWAPPAGGPNAFCPCGSGKKYKKCCGNVGG